MKTIFFLTVKFTENIFRAKLFSTLRLKSAILIGVCVLLNIFHSSGQTNINSLGVGGMVTETFSGVATGGFGADNAVNASTDNTTFPNWYIANTAANANFIYNSALTTADNTGSHYFFNLSGDKSLGMRASNGEPNLYTGWRLRNNTGVAVSSFYVSYYGEQWTIAENETPADVYHINNFAFSFKQGATVTTLNSGYTNVPALNFTQLHSCTLAVCTGTSLQRVVLNGNLASNKTLVQGCVDVAIPAGEEVMLQWYEANNPANDHHLQLDDLTVRFYDIGCVIVLPVDLISFNAEKKDKNALITWESIAEYDLQAYVVEHSNDGFNFDEVAELKPFNLNELEKYEVVDLNPSAGLHYYRLKIIDYNGQITYSAVRAVNFDSSTENPVIFMDDAGYLNVIQTNENDYLEANIYSINGQLINSFNLNGNNEKINPGLLSYGIYVLELKGNVKTYNQKIVIR